MVEYGKKWTVKEQVAMLPAGAKYVRRVAPNTIEYTIGDQVGWLFHETVIAQGVPDVSITLFTGGYKTSTTKDRLIKALRRFEAKNFSIYQQNGQWYLSHHYLDTKWTFAEGMSLTHTPERWVVSNPGDTQEHARSVHLNKLIDKYCNAIRKMDKLPEPDQGDCLYCQMGVSRPDCLRSHLEEQYIHGSLIYRALLDRGYPYPQLIIQIDKDHADVIRAVRRYFKKNLGLA